MKIIALIDKEKVVNEINRVLNSYDPNEITSGRYALVDLRNFLDTLEVKEMDLEKEFDDYIERQNAFTNNDNSEIKYYNGDSFNHVYDIYPIAKYFFELGQKVNCPITSSDIGMAEEIIINLKRVEKDYRIDLTKEIDWLRNKTKTFKN